MKDYYENPHWKKKNTNKYLLLLGEDITLCFLGAFFANAAEVSIVDCVGNLDTFDVKPGACGNHELLVDTTDGDAVDFVWSCKFQKLTIKSNFKSQMLNICTSDKKKTRLQSLKEHNTLSSMNTSQQNKNGSRLKRLANLGGTMLLGNFWPGLWAKEKECRPIQIRVQTNQTLEIITGFCRDSCWVSSSS